MSTPNGPLPVPEGFQSQRSSTPGMEDAARAFFRLDHPPAQPTQEKPDGVGKPEDAQQGGAAEAQEPAASEAGAGADDEGVQAAGDAQSDDAAAGDDEDPLLWVKIAGKEEQVPLSEVLNGYSRQADYTRSKQALAQERQQYEAEKASQQVAVQQEVARLSQFATSLETYLRSTQPNPQDDYALQQQDPGLWAARREERRQQEQAVAVARQIQAQHEQRELAQRIPRERAALEAAIPEFAANFDKTFTDLSQWVVSPTGGGLRPDEWGQVVDHRLVRLVHLAKIGAEALAGRQTDKANRRRVQADLSKLPRVRSGATQPQGDSGREAHDAALNRMRQPGGHSNAAIANAFLTKNALRKSAPRDSRGG